jgi:hypothetical protein
MPEVRADLIRSFDDIRRWFVSCLVIYLYLTSNAFVLVLVTLYHKISSSLIYY